MNAKLDESSHRWILSLSWREYDLVRAALLVAQDEMPEVFGRDAKTFLQDLDLQLKEDKK